MALRMSPTELSARLSITPLGGMCNFSLWALLLPEPVFRHSLDATFCRVFTMLVWAMGLKLEGEGGREGGREPVKRGRVDLHKGATSVHVEVQQSSIIKS